jgi:hypothetical protein
MGFLDRLRQFLAGPGPDASTYRIYAQCKRCKEPLHGRINLNSEPSRADDGEGWTVRKVLMGSGANRCFQTIDITLHFDKKKEQVIDSQVIGGKLITEEGYEALLVEAANAAAEEQEDKEEESSDA